MSRDSYALGKRRWALVVLSVSVRKGQVLHLLNVAMGDKAECLVAYLGQRQNDLVEVGIAFRLPNPNFWRVAFPPRDWSPNMLE